MLLKNVIKKKSAVDKKTCKITQLAKSKVLCIVLTGIYGRAEGAWYDTS